MASSTASTITSSVTAADQCTGMLCVVGPSAPPGPTETGPPPTLPAATWANFGPVELGMIAVSFGAILSTIAAPTKPRPIPAAPPMRPVTTDSPMTWPMIRLLRQPMAFSVPNSRARRDTADIVSSPATANAATSTRMDNQVPRSPASFAALPSEPLIWLARLAELVTVAFGSSALISLLTAEMSAVLAAVT